MNRIRQTAAAAIDSGLPGVFAWIESGVWPRSCDGAVQASRLVHERVANAIDCAYLDARRDIEAKRDAMDDGADIGEMRQALDRRGEAIEALELELADLRAKLALQQQIATGAATQRDEQTARLAEAQAEIAALRAERACKQCGKRLDTWCEQCDVPDEGEHTNAPRSITNEQACALWTELRRFDVCLSWYDVRAEIQSEFARIVGKHAGLTAAPQTDEVGT